MGHYAAEMGHGEWDQGETVQKAASSDQHWVVSDDFHVLRAIEYQRSLPDQGMAFCYRMLRKHYVQREDAEVAARERCEAAVEAARTRLLELKRTCVTLRPWEKVPG